MTHRSDRIKLASSEPRCEPARCPMKQSRCARYAAAIVPGAPMCDYSTMISGWVYFCPAFVDIGKAQAVAPAAPVVHETPRGLL